MTRPTETTVDDVVGDICHQLKDVLANACGNIMNEYEDLQNQINRVEFAVVVFSLHGESSITLSASGAPWAIIAQALQEASKTPQLISGPTRLQ